MRKEATWEQSVLSMSDWAPSEGGSKVHQERKDKLVTPTTVYMALGPYATLLSATWCPCIWYQSNYFVPNKHTLKQAPSNTACIAIDLQSNLKGKKARKCRRKKINKTTLKSVKLKIPRRNYFFKGCLFLGGKWLKKYRWGMVNKKQEGFVASECYR